MGPAVDLVESDETLPQRAAVVIIGGGIIGTSAALFLARKGVSVILCEKGHIAGEQSSRNWGWVRKMGRDPREIPLIIESLRLWQGMNELVGDETGFRPAGILYALRDRRGGGATRGLARARAALPARHADAEPSRDSPSCCPAPRRLPGALYTQSDGRAEPQKAAPAIARGGAARRGRDPHGLRRARHRDRGGRVAAAVTEKGRIACDSGGARRRGLVAPVLRQPRPAPAATQGRWGR